MLHSVYIVFTQCYIVFIQCLHNVYTMLHSVYTMLHCVYIVFHVHYKIKNIIFISNLTKNELLFIIKKISKLQKIVRIFINKNLFLFIFYFKYNYSLIISPVTTKESILLTVLSGEYESFL